MEKIKLSKRIRRIFKNLKLGLGISTRNRPEGLKHILSTAFEAVINGSAPYEVFVADDGSEDEAQLKILDNIEKGIWNSSEYNFEVKTNRSDELKESFGTERVGVANNKNRALRYLYNQGCDYIVIMEDDAYIKHPYWFTAHVLASISSGIHHFNFVPHSMPEHVGHVFEITSADNNGEFKIAQTQHTTGIFLFFTRECINKVGGFDKRFGLYGFEHVELSDRIRHPMVAMSPPGKGYPSLLNCEDYIGWDMDMEALISEAEKNSVIPKQRKLWDKMRAEYPMGFFYKEF